MSWRDWRADDAWGLIRNRLSGSEPEPESDLAVVAPPASKPPSLRTSLRAELDSALTPVVARLDLLERQNRLLMRQTSFPDETLWRGGAFLTQT